MNQFFAYDYCKQTILERAGDIMDVSVSELPAVMNSGTLVKQKQPRILYILLSHKGKQKRDALCKYSHKLRKTLANLIHFDHCINLYFSYKLIYFNIIPLGP